MDNRKDWDVFLQSDFKSVIKDVSLYIEENGASLPVVAYGIISLSAAPCVCEFFNLFYN